jgi:hypothetical protein
MPDIMVWMRSLDGASLTFGADASSQFQLLHHDGFAVGDFEHIATAAIDGHGDFWLDAHAKERIVTLDVLLRASSLAGLQGLRAQLSSTLNPFRGSGTLVLTQSNGIVRAFDCVLAEPPPMPTAAHIGARVLRTTLRLRSVGLPFLYDPAIKSVSVAANATGTFMFPLTFPLTVAQSGVGVSLMLNNAGDVPTPVQITVVGPAIAPQIRNATTDESVEWSGTVADASPLYVDTDPRVPVVTLYGAPAWSYLTRAEFWQLQPGANDVEIAISGTAGANTAATVQWIERYLGI